jgi:protein involved in polysaccharide export with SLBB domain
VKQRKSLIWTLAAVLVLVPAAWSQGTPDMPSTGSTGTVTLPPGLGDIPIVPPTRGPTTEGPARPAVPVLAGPVDPHIYRIGPGDVLQLQLWGRLSRSWLLTVNPEGAILLPGSGGVRVDGRTLASVRGEILRRVQSQFSGVNMDVQLAQPRTFRLYLTGQVKNPGPMTATGTNRVGDILTDGSLMDSGSRRRIELIHMDGTREIADLEMFLKTGRHDLNPYVRDGDVIHVPVGIDFVWAQGALARPGRFELGVNDSLRTLFRLAGDPIPSADIERALLLRWKDPFHNDSLWIRLDDVYEGRSNPVLHEGDRLYVYHLPEYHVQHEAHIFGEVARPGAYPVVENKHRLSDLVRAAGGFLPTADLSAIRVHRSNPAAVERDPELERLLRLSREDLTASEYDKLATKLAGLREDYRVDWKRLTESSQELDLLLRDGDIVRVQRLVSSIRVDGEVRRPAILSFRPGLDIGDYVRQAGGFTDRAWRSRVRVTRSVTGQTLPARNVRSLDPGDFVWVPERPDRTAWDHTRDILTAVAQVATVIIAIRSIN